MAMRNSQSTGLPMKPHIHLCPSHSRRILSRNVTLTLFTWLCLAYIRSPAQEPPLDIICLKNGHSFQGLILQETEDTLHFREVVRLPGKPTHILDVVFFREEIARIDRISEENRQAWLKKLEKLDLRGEKEKQRLQGLKLDQRPSAQQKQSWHYKGSWFTLIADLSHEQLVRRVIVRLEDMFQSLHEYFARTRSPATALVIRIFRDPEDYQLALKERGVNIANPAVYLPECAEILVVTNWEHLTEEYNRLQAKHKAQLRDLEHYEAQLRQHYHGQPPKAIMDKIRSIRFYLQRLDRENEAILERQLQPLLRLCYHEAFHAYLDLYVAERKKPIPRWLNEGLAQIFETAIVETGEIRIGHVDVERLKRAQELLRDGSFPRLSELLRSEPRHFQVNHRTDMYMSDRYFLASWAFTYFLLFALHSEGKETTAALSPRGVMQLLDETSTSENISKVLEVWTGRSLSALEHQFHDFLMRLRPDGTLRPAIGKAVEKPQ